MFKSLKCALTVFAMSGCLAVQADEYKCFVSGADGEKYIVFNEADNMGNARALARDQKVLVGVKRPVAVTRVFECAKLAERFLDSEASALDARTPR